MNVDPFLAGSRDVLPLISSATRWTALLPLLDSHFRAVVDHSANGSLKIEILPPSKKMRANAKLASLLESPSHLSVEYRRAQRHWCSQVMHWGTKHDTVIKLAADVGYRIRVRDLVFRDDLTVDDRKTALNFVTSRCPPEELRLTMAALHCIDEYFLLKNQGSKMSNDLFVRQAAKFIVTVYHLWEGGALPQEKRKWFRKLAHKGFYDLCHKILKERDMELIKMEIFDPQPNELLIIYVHSLAMDPSHPIIKAVEDRLHWSKQLIAQTIARSLLLRLANRPALFLAALSFARRYFGEQGLLELFRQKLDKRALLTACDNYNVSFVQAALHYCDLTALCHMLHGELAEMCREPAQTPRLARAYDTLAAASLDLWSRLLSLDNFLLFQVASSAEKGLALASQLLLEGCPPDILKTMILAVKSRREFCQTFVALCTENRTDLLDVYRRYFPFDLWDDMASYETFSGPSRAATAGHVGVLEIIREGYRRVKRESWHTLLSQLLGPRVLPDCSLSMAHYLYFEQELRPHLEHDLLLWKAIDAERARPLLALGSSRGNS